MMLLADGGVVLMLLDGTRGLLTLKQSKGASKGSNKRMNVKKGMLLIPCLCNLHFKMSERPQISTTH